MKDWYVEAACGTEGIEYVLAGRKAGLPMARTRRPEQYAAQVARIREEAARIFRERGYEQTSLDDIANALGVTKAAVYYYYKRKQDILFDICHQALDAGWDRLVKQNQALPAKERLELFIEDLLNGLIGQLEEFSVLMQEPTLRHERVAQGITARLHEIEQAVEAIIEQGIAEGVFRPVNARLATLALLGMCNWTHRWYRTERFKAEAIVNEFVALVEVGILAAGQEQMPPVTRGPAKRRRQPRE